MSAVRLIEMFRENMKKTTTVPTGENEHSWNGIPYDLCRLHNFIIIFILFSVLVEFSVAGWIVENARWGFNLFCKWNEIKYSINCVCMIVQQTNGFVISIINFFLFGGCCFIRSFVHLQNISNVSETTTTIYVIPHKQKQKKFHQIAFLCWILMTFGILRSEVMKATAAADFSMYILDFQCNFIFKYSQSTPV